MKITNKIHIHQMQILCYVIIVYLFYLQKLLFFETVMYLN